MFFDNREGTELFLNIEDNYGIYIYDIYNYKYILYMHISLPNRMNGKKSVTRLLLLLLYSRLKIIVSHCDYLSIKAFDLT